MPMPRPAGMGASIEIPDFDFETRSEAGFYWNADRNRYTCLPPVATGKKKGLETVGTFVYAMHPSTEVLSLAYDLKDGRGHDLWLPGYPAPARLLAYLATGSPIEAWHVMFEWAIWHHVCRRRYGWPELDPRQLRCAAGKARAFSLPGSLGDAGAVLGLDVQKDKRGKALLDKFSVPHTPTKKDPRHWHTVAEHPEEASALYAYNGIDIASEAAVSRVCPDLEGIDLEYWQADQAINRRGVYVDEVSMRACASVLEQAHARYNAELCALTGGEVDKASELKKLGEWLAARGVHLDSLDEETVEGELKRLGRLVTEGHCHESEIAHVYRALELRQAIGSASVKKVFAMSDQLAPDGRMHGLFVFNGARTGRPTGSGPQPTNLPKAGPRVYRCGWHGDKPTEAGGCDSYYGGHHTGCPHCGRPHPPNAPDEWSPEAAESALGVIRTRSLDAVEYVFGQAMLTVAGCLRGLYVAAPGHDLIASDYEAIEAVVLAALAGVEWRLDAIRRGISIYLASVARITGKTVEYYLEHRKRTGQHHPDRQLGKVAELASGFQGWIGSWKQFGADEFMSDDEIKTAILAWRKASPEIVEFWGGQVRKQPGGWVWENYGIEGAFVSAMQHRGQVFGHQGVTFQMQGDAVYCRLLSGRYLTYHRPRLEPSEREQSTWSISYEGWNTNPKNGPYGWITIRTWGGRLTENIVQATAHDLQRVSIVNHEAAGYPIVLHIYDENVAEVPEGWGSIEEFERLMMIVPKWAEGWPVRATGGWRGKRYRKS